MLHKEWMLAEIVGLAMLKDEDALGFQQRFVELLTFFHSLFALVRKVPSCTYKSPLQLLT